MSKARLVITAVIVEGRSQAEVARAYGVSKGWVSKLLARYLAEGEAAYEPQSRPHLTALSGLDDALGGYPERVDGFGRRPSKPQAMLIAVGAVVVTVFGIVTIAQQAGEPDWLLFVVLGAGLFIVGAALWRMFGR